MSDAQHLRRPACLDPETAKAARSTSPTHAATIAFASQPANPLTRCLAEQAVHRAVVVSAVILQRKLPQRPLALEAEPLEQPHRPMVVGDRVGLYPVQCHRAEAVLEDRPRRLAPDAPAPNRPGQVVAELGPPVVLLPGVQADQPDHRTLEDDRPMPALVGGRLLAKELNE